MKTISKEEALNYLETFGFSRISKRITLLWGYPELDLYLTDLLIMNREDREGFPDDIFSAILRLHNLHTDAYIGIPWADVTK